MRNIIAITQVTLDGVMQAPGGPEEDPSSDFTYGGWAMAHGDEVLHKVIDEMMTGKFDLLLGRWTYDIFANYWPNQEAGNPIAKAFNQATKYVVTRRQDALSWKTSVRITGEVVDGLRRLKASDGPELHVWGSSNLLQTLAAARLVDEYRLWVVPIVLGKGKRLFENDVPPRSLTLVESRKTSTGVLINTYRPAGPIKIEGV